MNKDLAKLLAKIVLRAQEIHEENTNPVSHYWCATEAAKEVGAPELADPVHVLNHFAWNDIQYWANEVSKEG